MKTLYGIRPKRFRDIWFVNNINLQLNHYFSDDSWKNSARLEVFYETQINTIFCKISRYGSSDIIFEDSFIYSSEEEALNWLFNTLDQYGHTHLNNKNKESVFNIPFTLYHYLGGNYGDYSTREIIINFLNYYRQHGSNLIILMEITSLGKLNSTSSPKMMTERLIKKAPNLSKIFTDFFVDRSLNDNKILTYFSDKAY